MAFSQPSLENPLDAGMESQLISEIRATGIAQGRVVLGVVELAKRADLCGGLPVSSDSTVPIRSQYLKMKLPYSGYAYGGSPGGFR
jgi:hypothetical protein